MTRATKIGGNRIGGDTDKHGCKASTGYLYDRQLKKCIRPWEYKCVYKDTFYMKYPEGPHGCVAGSGPVPYIDIQPCLDTCNGVRNVRNGCIRACIKKALPKQKWYMGPYQQNKGTPRL